MEKTRIHFFKGMREWKRTWNVLLYWGGISGYSRDPFLGSLVTSSKSCQHGIAEDGVNCEDLSLFKAPSFNRMRSSKTTNKVWSRRLSCVHKHKCVFLVMRLQVRKKLDNAVAWSAGTLWSVVAM